MPISPANIQSDFEHLLSDHPPTSPTTPISPISPAQSVSENPELAEGQILSAISVTDIQSDFQQLLNTCPSETLVEGGKHSLDEFANWLKAQKLSHVSIKNYLSDLRQFLKAADKTTDISQAAHDYISALHAPRATINRKLAAIRKYCIFLNQTISIPNLPIDPTQQLMKSFKAHLVKKRHSPKTITNYLSDLRHYLKWANRAQTYANRSAAGAPKQLLEGSEHLQSHASSANQKV